MLANLATVGRAGAPRRRLHRPPAEPPPSAGAGGRNPRLDRTAGAGHVGLEAAEDLVGEGLAGEPLGVRDGARAERRQVVGLGGGLASTSSAATTRSRNPAATAPAGSKMRPSTAESKADDGSRSRASATAKFGMPMPMATSFRPSLNVARRRRSARRPTEQDQRAGGQGVAGAGGDDRHREREQRSISWAPAATRARIGSRPTS